METQIKKNTCTDHVSRLSCQPPEASSLDRLFKEIDTVLTFSLQNMMFRAIPATIFSCSFMLMFGNLEVFSKNESCRAFVTICVFCVFLKLFISFWNALEWSEPDLPRKVKSKELNANNEEEKFNEGIKRKAFDLKLDSVIRRYAWRKLLEHSRQLERDCQEMDRKYFTCIVDWTAITFKHEVTKFSPKVKDGTVIKTSRGDLQTGEKWVTLWSSCYENLSKIKQSHIFRGSRDTTTWVEVDLERCYTVNEEVDVNFNLHLVPYFFNAENTVSINKFKGQVFHETLAWEINTEVEVEPSSRANAQLLARQECSVVEFEIRTTLSSPKGVVPVTFKHKDEDISFVLNIEDLHEAFQLVEEGGVLRPKENRCVELIEEKWLDEDGVEQSTSQPQIIARGTCVCLSWTDQKVDIKTSPLSMDESTCDGDHNMNKTPVCYTEEDTGVDSFVVVD
ncbi:uncharacterized protein LOC131952928 [Physella acuta]|uniref:uncharacterized protein LOC131952928 n=1 Tax=Physella acuta TaxID=109671 RepID=UPI0027DE80EF|nr:uncharacterized protein LOC131952928 [Physella acuta]